MWTRSSPLCGGCRIPSAPPHPVLDTASRETRLKSRWRKPESCRSHRVVHHVGSPDASRTAARATEGCLVPIASPLVVLACGLYGRAGARPGRPLAHPCVCSTGTRRAGQGSAPTRMRRLGADGGASPPPGFPFNLAQTPTCHHRTMTRRRRAVRVPGIMPAGLYPTQILVQNDCSHDCLPPPGCIYNLSIGGNRVCPEPPPPWIRPSPPSLRRTRAVSVTRPRRDPALPGAPAPPRRPPSRRRAVRHARAPGVCGVPAAWRLSA